MSKKEDIINNISGIESTIKAIQKKFGENSVMWFGESIKSFSEYDVMETGLYALDNALGNHGIVKGRILEIFGPESSGKTSLMLHLIRQAQRLGGVCAFVDAEHSLDPTYATNMGVDLNSLLIAQPDSAEECLDIVEQLLVSNCFNFVVLDSIGAMVTKEELEKTADNASVASLAKILTPSIKRINSIVSNNKAIFCAINQERDKIQMGWGAPSGGTTQPGGKAIKFLATYRLQIKRVGQVKKGGDIVGIQSKVKLVKNKAAAPFRESDFEILFLKDEDIYGIWEAADIYNIADQLGLLEGKGVRSFGDYRLGNGEFNSKLSIHSDLNVRGALNLKLRSLLSYPDQQVMFNEKLANTANVVSGIKNRVAKPPKSRTEDNTMAELAALQAAGVDLSILINKKVEPLVQEKNIDELQLDKDLINEEAPGVCEELPVQEFVLPVAPDFSRFLPSDD
jgi:recombination protein RecA